MLPSQRKYGQALLRWRGCIQLCMRRVNEHGVVPLHGPLMPLHTPPAPNFARSDECHGGRRHHAVTLCSTPQRGRERGLPKGSQPQPAQSGGAASMQEAQAVANHATAYKGRC